KLLRPEAVGDESRRQRFLQEARTAAALSHPNIATIYEAAEVDGTLFIAMELIEGESLRARLSRSRLPLDDVLRIACDVARGPAPPPPRAVVPRDLKPENVLAGADGRPRIRDFGLAKTQREPAAPAAFAGSAPTATMALTMHGQVMGTPAYMSPE